jgi:LysM repeat protein
MPGCSFRFSDAIELVKALPPVHTPSNSGGEKQLFVPLATDAVATLEVIEPTPTVKYTQPPSESSQHAATQTAVDRPVLTSTPAPPFLYYTQAGDTLAALALRFNVPVEQINSPDPIKPEGFIDPGQLLVIPQILTETSSAEHIMPDSEIVFSPSALDFELENFINTAGGYLASYKEWRTNGRDDAANAIYRVAIENSINPRLLLAILEYQSSWVYGQPSNLAQGDYPMGHIVYAKRGLYYQLSWAVQMLNIGYYGWRDGRITTLTFLDGTAIRLAPDLNAGSVALLYLFSQLYDHPNWAAAMYGDQSMPALYERMFGSPWQRAQTVEPLFPATLTQPDLELPFRAGKPWSLTGGPHSAWGPDGALAALDFAPTSTEHGCFQAEDYAAAAASGLVVRSETGVVVIDLDADGYEQTGWAILYLHIATEDRIPLGTWVNTDDLIGHPSCEGGVATGMHIHIARKYNGEWIQADGPLPFVLSGWRAHRGEAIYQGWLSKDDQTVEASVYGEYKSQISR